MKINSFFKKEIINFFTLEEIDSYKNGILLLDSSFFHLIPMNFSKGIDEREREFEITERLESIFEEYDGFYFLDKEITLQDNGEREKILLIMIEKDKIYTLLDNLKEKKISLLGIYPLFLVELFNKDSREKTYVEIEEEKYRLYYFFEDKLVDFQEREFEREELINNSTYLEENLVGTSFVYSNQKEITDIFFNLEIREWRDYPLEVRDDFNFLPMDYLNEQNYKKNTKLSIIFLSTLTIVSAIIFFSLYFLEEKEQKKLNNLEESYSIYHEKNLQIREEILKLEEEIKNIQEKNRVREFNSIKLSQLIESILKNGDLEFSSLEYGDGILNLQGVADSEEDIYNFQNSILSYKFFKKFNHDFIKLNNNRYEFHMDIEVKDEVSEKI